MLRVRILAVLLLVHFSAHAAASPSFDCKKAKSPIELLLCGDENLSRLDGEMGAAFGAALEKSARDAQETIKNGQRLWLNERLTLCNIPKKNGEILQNPEVIVACLTGIYQGRIRDLAALTENSVPGIELVSPTGVVKKVRQVAVRFTQPMVPLGDPRLPDPFTVQCPEKGKGRWADGRNWVFDFDRDLPAGIQCSFNIKENLTTLAGQPLKEGGDFSFSTGGPAVITSVPSEGNEEIDEEQVFLLGLDAVADPATIESKVYCQWPGVAEKIGVRLLSLEERRPLVHAAQDLVSFYLGRVFRAGEDAMVVDFGPAPPGGTDRERFFKSMDSSSGPLAALQCKRRMPPGSEVSLVWGSGITSISGVATQQDQVIRFRVREPFRARFFCERVNKKADCLPIRPLQLFFNAPVSKTLAQKIVLKGEGERRKPRLAVDSFGEDTTQELSFAEPFPEKGEWVLELPEGFKDDDGRDLANRGEFPLKIRMDEDPPLAKFPASFGIIEAKGDPVLPVTLRNLEAFLPENPGTRASSSAEVRGKDLALGSKNDTPSDLSEVRGRMLKVSEPKDFPLWLKRVNDVQNVKSHWDPKADTEVIDHRIGEVSVFGSKEVQSLSAFKLPKPGGARAFEVLGIPLQKPGFYVVELASQRLGSALHGVDKPYHVQTAALVTDMAAHFFRGRESSLVWVTSLDTGKPLEGAQVTVSDCSGHAFVLGSSDKNGMVTISEKLPEIASLPECPGGDRAFLVTARKGDDVTFVMSSWRDGIENWNFKLPNLWNKRPHSIHTVLDRSLFRAGETVHMKHFIRGHGQEGLTLPGEGFLPGKMTVQHSGGSEKYVFPLSWDAKSGSSESRFEIPKDAKFGVYEITINNDISGSFNVEAFRLPVMKAMVKPVKVDLVNAASVELDLQISYLAGGGAGDTPVKVRGMLSPGSVVFPGYEGFVWVGGEVKEGRRELGRTRNDDGGGALDGDESSGGSDQRLLPVVAAQLDAAGGGRVVLSGWDKVEKLQNLTAEMEYRDPSGEISVSSARVSLWPAAVLVGIKLDSWMQGREAIKFNVATVDTTGKAKGGTRVVVDVLERKTYSHRKRLLGGFYSYDQYEIVRKVGEFCAGTSDNQGTLVCEGVPPAVGNLIVQARVVDEGGNSSFSHAEVWVPEEKGTWFSAREGDRMDVLAEKKRYEPGEKANLQVRMPFREATALVVVEREGVMDAFVQTLSGQLPQVSVPILGNYGPNVYVAVLAVRGRNSEVQPTALVDLGRPAMRLGLTQLQVGWQAYALNVGVTTDRPVYKTRETAEVTVAVDAASGLSLPDGGEVALAAVDEGLLELLPNDSWKLLEGMMAERGLEVEASTAMGRVVGRRHFGQKAVSHGGGGGRGAARELFDTLLFWDGRVKLDGKGRAKIKVPLNDSITSFRIVAVASAGAGLFGTGSTSIRSSRDVVLFSGLPPVVREGDHFRAGFTVRNAGEVPIKGQVRAKVTPDLGELSLQDVALVPGEAKELFWEVTAPHVGTLAWDVEVTAGGVSDRVKVVQEVLAAVPVRVMQATLSQVGQEVSMELAVPSGALPGRGGVRLSLMSSLVGELAGVGDYMRNYPYTCMEQRVSKAVALQDDALWAKVMVTLPSHLDRDGLVKYFPRSGWGSDVLTSYMLAVAATAGWEIPEGSLESMKKGLKAFVEGRISRDSAMVTADLTMRRVAALAALARYDVLDPGLAGSITVEPNLWPTSTLVDWVDLLALVKNWPDGDKLKEEALGILRSRLNFTGSTMGFSTEKSDYFWWLMVSADVNANRVLLAVLKEKGWREDWGRMVRGSLLRRDGGHWSTTVANAWGVLAVKRFGEMVEGEKVSGVSASFLAGERREFAWSVNSKGGILEYPWPQAQAVLRVEHQGLGKPWLTVESLAAIPLSEPFFAGYRLIRTVTAVERKKEGEWHRGDVYRVRLELEAQADMTWVVVNDPVPGGSTILGSGLGGDSQVMARGEKSQGWVWPAFTERTFDSYRAYYDWVPKGKWMVEYTVRLNTAGDFQLPGTHVEAMYAPEMFGELTNSFLKVLP